MPYDFDELVPRRGTCSVKWDSGPNDTVLDENCIPMWVADMDFACAPPIVEALHNAVDRRIYGYSHLPENYYGIVIDFFRRRHNFTCDEQDIVFSQGVVPMLHYAVKAFTKPGEGVIVQTPVYYPFFSAIGGNDRVVVENPLINNNGVYTIDFDDLEAKAADPNNKLLLICSPHNPVGRVWTEEELRRMQDICLRHDLILMADEIHFDLIRSGFTHRSVMELFPDAQNILCCTAPSKTFNLAGMGASHAICKNAALCEKLAAEVGRQGLHPLSAEAVVAAYTKCDDWLDEANAYMDGNFERFYELCAKHFPKAVVTRTEGTYLAWMDVRAYTQDTKALEEKLLNELGVYIECGDAFHGQGWLRINLACPRAYIDEAFRRASVLVK